MHIFQAPEINVYGGLSYKNYKNDDKGPHDRNPISQ